MAWILNRCANCHRKTGRLLQYSAEMASSASMRELSVNFGKVTKRADGLVSRVRVRKGIREGRV